MGFEPTPSFEDQNAWDPTNRASNRELESGALDRSAILTLALCYCDSDLFWLAEPMWKQNGHQKMFLPGIEPGTFRVWGERDDRYTTETV